MQATQKWKANGNGCFLFVLVFSVMLFICCCFLNNQNSKTLSDYQVWKICIVCTKVKEWYIAVWQKSNSIFKLMSLGKTDTFDTILLNYRFNNMNYPAWVKNWQRYSHVYLTPRSFLEIFTQGQSLASISFLLKSSKTSCRQPPKQDSWLHQLYFIIMFFYIFM